jgi:hypothetical protein
MAPNQYLKVFTATHLASKPLPKLALFFITKNNVHFNLHVQNARHKNIYTIGNNNQYINVNGLMKVP